MGYTKYRVIVILKTNGGEPVLVDCNGFDCVTDFAVHVIPHASRVMKFLEARGQLAIQGHRNAEPRQHELFMVLGNATKDEAVSAYEFCDA